MIVIAFRAKHPDAEQVHDARPPPVMICFIFNFDESEMSNVCSTAADRFHRSIARRGQMRH